jgi:hypothetical protein
MKINEIVQALNAGASADIWYDPDTFGNNNGEAEVIERAQNAMTEAAKLLSDFITLGQDQETTEPTIPEGSFHIKIERTAIVWSDAIISATSLEEAKSNMSERVYKCDDSTVWSEDGPYPLDNIESCEITSPDGTVVVWQEGFEWDDE